jgi:hypothetical protein
MSKYGHRSVNWFEAIVNKLGGEAQAERLLRGELAVVESNTNGDALWQTPAQAAGGACSLQRLLLDAAPHGETHTIDWYLEDPENRIPKEWEGKCVFFSNSKFRGSGGDRCVRFLYQSGGRWCRGCSWVSDLVYDYSFLAVPASAL